MSLAHEFCVRSISRPGQNESPPRGDGNSFYEMHKAGGRFCRRKRETGCETARGKREWVVSTRNARKSGRNSIRGRFQRFPKSEVQVEI